MIEEKKQAFDQQAYKDEYNKQNYSSVAFRVHKVKDIDIITALSSVPSKAEYIKNLIRQDIEKTKK